MSKDRNKQAKQNYQKLRAAGYSAKEAARRRYSSPERIKNLVREKRTQDRQARARENYARLKAAGFSTKEAERYRYSSPEKIEAALKAKALPPVEQKKRGRAKVKIKEKEFNSSSLREVFLQGYSSSELKKAMQERDRAISDGYKFSNLAVSHTYASGQEQYFSTVPKPIRDQWEDSEDLSDIIGEIIDGFGDYYSPIGKENPVISIILRFWRPK